MTDEPYIGDDEDNFIAPLSHFEAIAENAIYDYLKEDSGFIQDVNAALTPIEQETINYVKSIMSAINEVDIKTGRFNRLASLAEMQGFAETLNPRDRGAFGRFIERDKFFDLKTMFPEQAPNAPVPDIPPPLDTKLRGIEIKTRMAGLSKAFKIGVGLVTIEGGNIERALDETEIGDLNRRWEDTEFLLKIAKERLINKMSNFLFIRAVNKGDIERYHQPIQGYGIRAKHYNVLAKRRASPGANLEVVAFILFMRLIVAKIEELFNKTGEAEFRVSVDSTGITKTSQGLVLKKQFRVSLVRDILTGKDERGLWESSNPIDKLARELSYIRELYAQEHDFINRLEVDRFKTARKFYWEVKNNLFRKYKFTRIE